jgi:IclR family transcriptional regulator, pca regulon regulatory protein
MKIRKMNKTGGSASSLVRGLQVLECFGPRQQGYTLSELVKKTNMPKTSIHRVLKTLSGMNYLRYDELSKRYHLGVRILSLGFAVLESLELREIARPYMESLSRECMKTVNLGVLDKEEMVYVERIKVQGIRSYNISIGNRMPPWDTALGRAVLAHLDIEEVKKMIDRAKKQKIFNSAEKDYLKTLHEVKNSGFALVDQEYIKGIIAIAVPVFSTTGVIGAINMVGEPETVSTDQLAKDYAPKLIEVGALLSDALGYRRQK